MHDTNYTGDVGWGSCGWWWRSSWWSWRLVSQCHNISPASWNYVQIFWKLCAHILLIMRKLCALCLRW